MDEENYDDGLATWQRYDMHSQPNGSYRGWTSTNDNEDRGYPSPNGVEQWEVVCRNKAAFDSQVGVSRVGVGGCVVTVILDGRQI